MINQIRTHLRKRGFSDEAIAIPGHDYYDQLWTRPDTPVRFRTSESLNVRQTFLTAIVGDAPVTEFTFFMHDDNARSMSAKREWMVEAMWDFGVPGSKPWPPPPRPHRTGLSSRTLSQRNTHYLPQAPRALCTPADVMFLIDAVCDKSMATALAGIPWASAIMAEVIK